MAEQNRPAARQSEKPTGDKSNGNGGNGLGSLSFQDVDAIPTGDSLNAMTNPFQEKVNELARTKKGAFVDLPDDQVDNARTLIRRACGNINMGAKTRVTATTPKRDGFSRVWFQVGDKVERKRKTV